MQSFMVQITRADGSYVQRSGLYSDALAATHIALATFPDAKLVTAETFSTWLAAQPPRQESARHDTEKLPCGGFYFAPGALDSEPGRKPRSAVKELAVGGMTILAIAGVLGALAAWAQASGWPQ